MKKLVLCTTFLFAAFLCGFMQVSFAAGTADENVLKNAGISKYAVLETTFNYAPIRERANADSKRFTHLKKGIFLFSDEVNSDFFKVDLGLNKSYWIEKRYVEVCGSAAEKTGSSVSKIKFYEDKNNYLVKITTPVQTSYKIDQTKAGLKFQLFNVSDKTDRIKIRYKGYKDKFSYSFKSAPNSSGILTINYNSHLPVFGYDVIKEDNALVFRVRKPVKVNTDKPLKGVKIALDAGHGGSEKGAVSGGVCEKDINLEITKELNKALKKRGAKTVLTRKKDINLGLYKRVDFANKKEADFLISIHQNSLPNPKNYEKKHGTGVYYYNENAKKLAYSVQKNMVKSTGFRDDGVFNASFALTRSTNPVSILVECGYIIHPYERERLTNKAFQKMVASAVADGVEEYLRAAK